MISINRTAIEDISKSKNSKSLSGKNDALLYPIFSHSLMNFVDYAKELSTYEMAHWINNNDRWLHNQKHVNTIGYKRGSIVYVDLGATNYRYEPSFTHPCVVLSETRDFILVVPCSSKKFGSGFPEIIDATAADGFSCNTGIQTKSFRWVSKNRVIAKLGTTSNDILNKIDLELLKLIPVHSKMMFQKDNDIQELTEELKQMKLALQQAEEKIQQLEKEKEISKSA